MIPVNPEIAEKDPLQVYRNGIAYQRCGDIARARDCYEQATTLKKDFVEAHFRLAALHSESGELQAAITRYRKCVRLEPKVAATYNNLGLLLQKQGDLNGAIACMRKSIALDPLFAEAFTNLGSIYSDTGDRNAALACHKKVVRLRPGDATAHYNLGVARQELGQLEASKKCFYQAIRIRPDFSEALNNLGLLHKRSGLPDKAVDCFEKATNADPNNRKAAYNLGKLLQDICDWRRLDEVIATIHQQTLRAIKEGIPTAEEPFFNLTRSQNLELNFQVARSHSHDIASRCQPIGKPLTYRRQCVESKKLKIGYLGDSFGNHPTAHLMMDVFSLHNREKYGIHCYAYGSNDRSTYRQHIEKSCDHFVDIANIPSFEAANWINQDGIHILVDLKGHTTNSRLDVCAYRPAPIQVRYLGMAGSSGAPFFDYIITDKVVTPQAHSPFYSEKFVYMPNGYQVNSPKPQLPNNRSMTRKKMGLPENGIVFAAFLSGYKVDRHLFDCWVDMLKQVPGSVLWLWERDGMFRKNIIREAMVRSLSPERIVFAKELPKNEHLSRLSLADLCLDACRVNGAATTSDALWAGVPVITVQGGHFASRMSASILTSVGLPELITDDLNHYELLAVNLATNRCRLNSVKSKLAKNKHIKPLFNTAQFVRDLECGYSRMWEIYKDGKDPQQICVNNHR
jgi:protein O-GlcNAc transferase